MKYGYLILAFVCNASANALIKLSAAYSLGQSGSVVANTLTNPYLIVGMVVFFANFIFFFLALKKLPLSVGYPVMIGMSFVLINLFAYFYIGEAISIPQGVGYILILAGLTCVLAYHKNHD